MSTSATSRMIALVLFFFFFAGPFPEFLEPPFLGGSPPFLDEPPELLEEDGLDELLLDEEELFDAEPFLDE